jgi:hypothetical protein
MELEITVLRDRLFMLLDDGWYILNKANETKRIELDPHKVTVFKKDGHVITYFEDRDSDKKEIRSWLTTEDGRVISDDIIISYDMLKHASKTILSKDEEGIRICGFLNGVHEGKVNYVEAKGYDWK